MGFLLGLLAGGLLVFNAAVTPGKVAGKTQSALQKLYPSAQVSVNIEGKRGRDVLRGQFRRARIAMSGLGNTGNNPASAPGNTGSNPNSGLALEVVPQAESEGRIGRLDVELRDFVAEGVPIEAARLETDDLRFDWKALQKSKVRVVGATRTWAWARIGKAGVARLIAARLPGTREVQVSLNDGRVTITGRREFLGLGEVPFQLDARPEGEGNALHLRDAHLQVIGATLPAPVANALLDRIDPVYTFDKAGEWPVRVSLHDVRAQRDGLELEADLQWKTPQ